MTDDKGSGLGGMGPLCTPEQLAERWGIQPQTLAVWRCQGKGPRYLRIGHSKRPVIRYPLKAIEDYEREVMVNKPGENPHRDK